LFAGHDAMDEEDEDVNVNQLMDTDIPRQHQFGADSTGIDGTTAIVAEPQPLPTRIVTPSPYGHHTRGPSSARFRNALGRVTTHPTSDAEAWTALFTEVQTCWKQLQQSGQLHLPSADTQAKFDWLVSCYGSLLQHFPYAVSYWVQLGEILLEASAQPGEPAGPKSVTTAVDTSRAWLAEGQLEQVLRQTLNYKTGPEFGIVWDSVDETADNDGKQANDDDHLRELSFLHPPQQKQQQQPQLGEEDQDAIMTGADDFNVISSATVSETAKSSSTSPQQQQQHQHEALTKVLGGMGTWSVPLWMLYLKKVHRDLYRHVRTLPRDTQAKWLRDQMVASYELALKHAGFGHDNHLIWTEYLNFVKSWTIIPPGSDEAQDPIVVQQQMIQLRSIYQRLVQLPMTGLDQLWNDYEAFERSHSEELAQALLAEYTPKYQHARTVYLERARVYNYSDAQLQLGRLPTPPVTRRVGGTTAGETKKEGDEAETTESLSEYLSNLKEEYHLLQAWKKRVSYERTNPERLPASELPKRVRHAHMEMISVLTRHPEAWHMWSMYEYHHAHRPVRGTAVLQLALTEHVTDCTLLAHAQAQLVEAYCANSSAIGTISQSLVMSVMEQFLQSSPNTLGFCLYQQMVRRYQGMHAARVVFAKARRVLTGEAGHGKVSFGQEGTDIKDDSVNDGAEDEDIATASSKTMVTNRLDANIGRRRRRSTFEDLQAESTGVTSSNGNADSGRSDTPKVTAGPITWHLYASHATMEHRLNYSPDVAARVYELGLRNHPHFLTQPPFVLRYAQLLLELNDTVNLRALLTRAVAAVTDEDGTASGPLASVAAVLWDMTLQFETILSGADPLANQLIRDVERKRHMALMGPDTEDVATGGFILDTVNTTTIGAQKSTIAEQLIRNDGYDVSSTLVSGMARSVSVLEVMGLWGSNVMGSGVSIKHRSQSNKAGMESLEEEEDLSDRSGGASDVTYQRRLLYQRLYESGVLQGTSDLGADLSGGATGTTGNRLLSARERMATAGGPGAATNAAINIAIQQQPEWIRPLLLMLPASKMRMAMLTKPPPHLTEMALLQLRQSILPAERPEDEKGGATMSSRSARISGQKRGNDGDSSDEEDNAGRGGYGLQFRARQRARMMTCEVGDAGGGDP